MAQDRVYINQCSLREKTFDNGGSLINAAFKVSELQEHADENGWVNFPDWQMRIYRNKEEIYWIKPVHEQLKGYTKFANLPAEEKFALYHPKDIGRQEKQNAFYETI